MKSFKLTAILLFVIAICGYGQEFQSFHSNCVYLFEGNNGNVKSIRFDSVKYQNDSIFHPFKVIQYADDGCFLPNSASWIGEKIIIKENGENLFFNQLGDTIRLNTKAVLGDSWVAFNLIDSLTIYAEIDKYDTMSFLGLTDSVKAISFHCYDKNMNSLSLPLNNMQVLISKNYGIIHALDFYLFPNFKNIDEGLKENQLIGLSNPKVGTQNLTWFDVHDFQVGDELHILEELRYYSSHGFGVKKTVKSKMKYLKRTDYQDSISYRFAVKKSVDEIWDDSSSHGIYYDTLESTIKPDSIFNKLPGEPFMRGGLAQCTMSNDTPLSKMYPQYGEYKQESDSCWKTIGINFHNVIVKVHKYMKGLGGPYYNATIQSGDTEKRELMYYKKGNYIWGSPLTITGIKNITFEDQLDIYPNPVDEVLQIHLDKAKLTELKIITLQGKVVLHNTKNIETVDATQLLPGIYILECKTNSGQIYTAKIIKR